MDKTIFVGIFVITLFLISGCQNPFDDKNYFPKDAIDCGFIPPIIDKDYNVEYNGEVKDCFYNAFKNCESAFIGEKHNSMEGDYIFQYAFIEEETCRILFFEDTRQDMYGPREIRKEYCSNISIMYTRSPMNPNESIKLLMFGPCGQSRGGQAIY